MMNQPSIWIFHSSLVGITSLDYLLKMRMLCFGWICLHSQATALLLSFAVFVWYVYDLTASRC